MQYSVHVHEPEDELLHMKYHNCVNILLFKGWTDEREVTRIPEWDIGGHTTGRIIFVCSSDSIAKKDRINEVLAMVDRDLGFATRPQLKPKILVRFRIICPLSLNLIHLKDVNLIFPFTFRCIWRSLGNRSLAFVCVWCKRWNEHIA